MAYPYRVDTSINLNINGQAINDYLTLQKGEYMLAVTNTSMIMLKI
jgi:hypothetical protein